MCSLTQLLWYANNGYFIFFRYSKQQNWVEWRPENGYDPKAMYKVINEKTLGTTICG